MAHASTKSVIVTGASRGIGRNVATRLARDGFAVAVNYAGNATKADEVVAEIRNITVNAVAPGPVATELFLAGKAEEQIDIANLVSFLAGPDGGWINGQVLRANGGFE
jgi:NAD(P)-dependent dehydrogenase (short-subunit alcohol dehydrogenase family)